MWNQRGNKYRAGFIKKQLNVTKPYLHAEYRGINMEKLNV